MAVEGGLFVAVIHRVWVVLAGKIWQAGKDALMACGGAEA